MLPQVDIVNTICYNSLQMAIPEQSNSFRILRAALPQVPNTQRDHQSKALLDQLQIRDRSTDYADICNNFNVMVPLPEEQGYFDWANYYAALVKGVSPFADQDSGFEKTIAPFLNKISSGMSNVPVGEVVSAFFTKRSTPGGLPERMATRVCLDRFQRYGFSYENNEPGVPTYSVAEVFRHIADRPQSAPEVAEYLKIIGKAVVSDSNIKYVLTSLFPAVASPHFGGEAERIIREKFPNLTPEQRLSITVMQAKRALYQAQEDEQCLQIARELVSKIHASPPSSENRFTSIHDQYYHPAQALTDAVKKKGDDTLVARIVQPFQEAYISAAFMGLPTDQKNELIKIFFRHGTDAQFVKWVSQTVNLLNPTFIPFFSEWGAQRTDIEVKQLVDPPKSLRVGDRAMSAISYICKKGLFHILPPGILEGIIFYRLTGDASSSLITVLDRILDILPEKSFRNVPNNEYKLLYEEVDRIGDSQTFKQLLTACKRLSSQDWVTYADRKMKEINNRLS